LKPKFSQNAGTAHPLEQTRAASNQIIVFTQLEIYKLQSLCLVILIEFVNTILEEEHSKSITSEVGPI
jgi:hypothetical protein